MAERYSGMLAKAPPRKYVAVPSLLFVLFMFISWRTSMKRIRSNKFFSITTPMVIILNASIVNRVPVFFSVFFNLCFFMLVLRSPRRHVTRHKSRVSCCGFTKLFPAVVTFIHNVFRAVSWRIRCSLERHLGVFLGATQVVFSNSRSTDQ